VKKLIFLLILAFALVGFVSAGVAHPPGAYSPEMADIVMAEYGVQEGVVTQPTVLDMVTPVTAEPSSIQAVMAHYFIAIQPDSYLVYDKPPGTGQDWTDATADYYLRC